MAYPVFKYPIIDSLISVDKTLRTSLVSSNPLNIL